MFVRISRRHWQLIFILILALVTIPVLAATASHTIAVTVPEIARYRVNGISLVRSAAAEAVYQVDLAVFSNSQRQWKMVANTENSSESLEWSNDGQNWSGLAAGMTTVAIGAKADWVNFRIYYRYQPEPEQGRGQAPKNEAAANESPLNLQYQLCFSN